MATDSLIADTTARIFADLGDPRAVNAASDDGWKRDLWRALEDAGLPLLWVPETAGGAGASFVEGLAALEAAGAAACAVPLADTMTAAWLAAAAGLEVPTGPLALMPAAENAVLDDDGRITGAWRDVPFASMADHHLAVLADGGGGYHVALLVRPSDVVSGTGLAGDERGDVRVSDAMPFACAPLPAMIGHDGPLLVAAAGRAALMAGALGALVGLSVDYAGERVAFGRPIGKFQAVQQALARLAGEAAAASVAAQASGWALDSATKLAEAEIDVAAAKVRAGEAAGAGSAIAHQVHGAIGFTAEHVLHRYTHRLWSWRDEYGSESLWAERLGRRIAAAGGDGFWGLLTGVPEPTLQAGGAWA